MINLIRHEYSGGLKSAAELYIQNLLTLPDNGHVSLGEQEPAVTLYVIDLAMAIMNGMAWQQPPDSADGKSLVTFNNKTGKFDSNGIPDNSDTKE